MRRIILSMIQIYWLAPARWKRSCLFKVSCSHHVYTTIQTKGLKEGIEQLLKRYRQCRPGYSIYTSDDKKEWVVLADRSIVGRAETTL